MNRPLRTLLATLAVGALTLAAAAAPAQQDAQEAPARRPDVIFVPTPPEVVDAMLEVAEVKEGDVVYDLGCGDGRIVVAAAKRFKAKGVGIDIDPQRIKESRENVAKNGVEDLVTIKQADIFQEDLSKATVITMYLLPTLNEKLRPTLEKLKPGTRIVSHSFDMRGAKPKRIVEVGPRRVLLWVVPFDKED
jgi:tRNA A58 N-methylase Trm61